VSKQGPAHEEDKATRTVCQFKCCGGAEHALKNSHTKNSGGKTGRQQEELVHMTCVVREANGYAGAFMNELLCCWRDINEQCCLNPFSDWVVAPSNLTQPYGLPRFLSVTKLLLLLLIF
jgi:hypothetical protein